MEIIRKIIFILLKKPVHLFVNHKFNLHCNRNDLAHEKGAALILGHHVTNYDPIITNIYSPRLIRFISSDTNMDLPVRAFFLKLLGMIPFSKNNTDTKAIRALLSLTQKGHLVGLYPEGGRNWDGTTEPLIYSSAKLVKLLNVSVYVTSYEGGYLSQPRWSNHIRKGKLTFSSRLLLSQRDLSDMSVDTIYKAITQALLHNAYEIQHLAPVAYHSKTAAQYIERLLYKCPNCLTLDSFSSRGQYFSCRHCQHTYHYNDYGFIEGCDAFENLHDWNTWQRSFLTDIANDFSQFSEKEMSVLIRLPRQNETKPTSVQAFVLLTQKCIQFQLPDQSLTVMIKDVTAISITFQDTIEFYHQHALYRLKFDPLKHTSVKLFYDLLLILKERATYDN